MEHIHSLIEKQRRFFREGRTLDVSYRYDALLSLRRLIQLHEQELMNALQKDLNKSEFEAYTTEIGVLLSEINYTLKHFRRWAKPRRVKSTLVLTGSKGYIYPEPYGVTLIISPWNYPLQLAFAPLIGAIAAGNCAVIKPSELTPETSKVIAELVRRTFPEEYIAVVEGDVEASQALLNEKVDYIFFTGSVPVGRVIMEAAAKQLIPVTLELGGKSPCIVHQDAKIQLAAKRIAWGKFLNGGQTCVAPDYAYVHQSVKEQFIKALQSAISEIYGEIWESGQFTFIVSEKHFDRLEKFLSDGRIVHGGRTDRLRRMIEPTVLDGVTWGDRVMEDEIFGPILPILTYKDETAMIEQIQQRPKPLALYVFSESSSFQNLILKQLSFGGGCVNDTVFHLVSPHLPFGGVGESGIGAYHGKGSFDVFSHEKSILKQTTVFDVPFRYPNRTHALKWIKRFLK